MFPHEPTHFELDGALGRHVNARQRLGVLRDACGSGPGFKNAKVSEFQTVILAQLSGYLIEERLNNALHCHSLGLRLLSNPIDQFFLGNRCHRLPHLGKEHLGIWILLLVAEAAA